MPTRVGITTDPEERKKYWSAHVVGLSKWKILKHFKKREEAQEYEKSYAKRYGCVYSPGGQNAEGTWFVYRFEYVRKRS